MTLAQASLVLYALGSLCFLAGTVIAFWGTIP